MSKYVIIDAEAIQKRIEELKFQREREPDNYTQSYLDGKLNILKEILSKSTPLIPEIENAIKEGIEMRSETEIYGRTEKTTENYISNLNLDI